MTIISPNIGEVINYPHTFLAEEGFQFILSERHLDLLLLENKLFWRMQKNINDAKFAQRLIRVFSFFFRHKTAALIFQTLQHEE